MTAQLVASYASALKHGSNRKYEVLLLHHDEEDSGQAFYMNKSGIKFPSIRIDKTEECQAAKAFPLEAMPQIVLVDALGQKITDDVQEIMTRLANNS